MTTQELQTFAQLVRTEADTLLDTWRSEVTKLPSAKGLSIPVLNDHIPALLEEVATAFETRTDKSITQAMEEGTPTEHGVQRYANGFDLMEVVAEYSILRRCLHDLAVERQLRMAGSGFHILNRIFDEAIGMAVKAYAEQRAAEVLARRQEYLSFVAHDLRAPLNAIALGSSALEVMIPAQGEAADVVRTLHRNVVHLKDLVHRVMEENINVVSNIGVPLEAQDLDLHTLVGSLIQDLHPEGSSDKVVLDNAVPTKLMVHADVSLIRRVLQNLIGNAIAFTPNGTITIGAQAREEDEVVECWVSDTGKGIAPHLLGKVLQKGAHDDSHADGKGLGLAIVKAFVEAHGGAVHAESEEGKGATFRFTLPARAGSDAVK